MTRQRAGPLERGMSFDGEVRRGSFAVRAQFDAAAGEVLGVLGPNGAGKSTLLRTLAGLEPLAAGRLTLCGEVLDEPAAGRFVPAERRAVAVVFQNYRLFPSMTVRDNVAFAARCRGERATTARASADGWLQRLDLADLADEKPRRLSGGQAQRVALARALAAEPALLLLDEPLAALDARTKLDVRGNLRRHLRDYDGATVLVTHDPLEAMVLTDRLVVVEDGRVVQRGTPAEIARRPATDYVARLVGLNFYRGRYEQPGLVRLVDGSTLVTAAADLRTVDVVVVLRPNAISLHTTQPEHGSPRNVWRGTVIALELLTDRVRAEVDSSPPATVDLTAAAVADLRLVEGTPVWLSAKATDVEVYPAS